MKTSKEHRGTLHPSSGVWKTSARVELGGAPEADRR